VIYNGEESGQDKKNLQVSVLGDAINELVSFCGCKEALMLKIQVALVADDDIKAEIKVESNSNALTY